MNCKHITRRSKKYEQYWYCRFYKKKIELKKCYKCSNFEVKKSKEIKKKSGKLSNMEKKRFSILTTDMEHCYVCVKEKIIRKKNHTHEIFGGRNRQVSIKHGFTIPICKRHHDRTEADMNFDKELKKECQRKYEEDHTRDEFLALIDQNYLLEEEIKMKKEEGNIILGICIGVIVLILIIGCCSVTTVPTGYVGVKTRFGKVQNDVIQEGLNTKVPFIEKIVKINCKTQKIEETTESSTKDLQTVSVSIAVNYNVSKDTANTLYQEVGKEYEDVIIKPAILESIKSAMAQYNAEELVTKRTEVSNEIQEILREKILERGFAITEFNITNIDFSEEYNNAIEAKAVKQQEVETARAELEKQQIENERKITEAEKDAKVMELQNSQVTENTLRLKALEIQQEFINKWNGQLPTTTTSDAIPFLNLN